MSKRDLAKAGKLVSYLLIILLFSAALNLLHIIMLSTYARVNVLSTNAFTLFRISITLQFLLTIACVFLIWMNTKNLSKGIALLTREKDTIAANKQMETDTLNHMVQNLSTLYSQAVENDNLKTEFYSNLSHELKTPLSVMLGAIQLMEHNEKNAPSPGSRKHMYTIKQNCYRILRLINNLLDTTRIESGFIKMNLEDCNIIYLIEEMVQSVVPYAEEKNIHIEFDTEVEEIITAVDIDKIERIMLNLLSNAIKFTPADGNIWVTISEGPERIKISVKDTGPGIPKDMHTLIFNRFQQVNNSLTRTQEGSGIGLSLVKSFVELHSGKIELLSEENAGSEFIIELPISLCLKSPQNMMNLCNHQSKIIQAINIEFSDIYRSAS